MTYDLVVAYRIYPKISKVPPAYPTDKYKLSELCLASFKEATHGLKVKMYVILDNCPKEYELLFKKYFPPEDLVLIPVQNIGNKATFKKQIEILTTQQDSNIVYCAEDDYFYIKNIKNMLDFLKSGATDFVTPYEHPSSYTDHHVITNKIQLFHTQRYVSVQHACLTFMTTKKNLIANRRFFLIFSNWFGSDFVVWGCITLGLAYFKYFSMLFNPKNYTISNIKVFGSLKFFAWYRFLLNRKYTLSMPIDTFATHMESDFLSPGIDWNNYFKDKH